ncbi:MAG: MBOAT family protein [Clostridia bacterium]|nr:MBOAT family protein [Clostridia bacterium]
MVFSSFVFASVFFPLVYFINRLLPVKASNIFLLIASLFLYAWGEPVYVLLLIACALVNYLTSLLIDKNRRVALILALVLNLSMLCTYKYTNFIIENINGIFGAAIPAVNIRMPLGISFFTFQAMSYTIDVYRGECAPQRNFAKLLLYIALFPQLIAGPIVKYHEIETELTERRADMTDTVQGARRFIVGLSKKILLANALATTADMVFNSAPELINMPVAWLGAIAYAFQIYFDFSGYTDMAIGMGRMMGFHFPENFRYPYAARSMQDFWRRWHISLSSWFRNYVYIPLGGNRKGKTRAIVNRIIVFFLTGLWHGASWNFVIWGLGNGALLMLESAGIIPVKKLTGKLRPIAHIYVWLCFILLFVIFRAETLSQTLAVYKGMFTGFTMTAAQQTLLAKCLTGSAAITLAAGIICALPWKEKLNALSGRARTALGVVSYIACLGLLWLSLMSLASQAYNPFIYFRF